MNKLAYGLFLCLGIVQALQHDVKQNHIKNGDFKQINLQGKSWIVTNKLDGWNLTEAEFGNGKLYNPNWGNYPVLEIDGNKNNLMEQTVQLSKGEYEVYVKYAARTINGRVDKATNGLKILWNKQVILDVQVDSAEIREFRHKVQAVQGQNTIAIEGSQKSDSLGVTISEIELTDTQAPEAEQLVLATLPASERVCTQHSDFIVNGDFTTYNLQGKAWTIVNKLDGWTLTEAEFGNGKLYNSNWGNHVVLELDGHKNNVMSQKIQLKAGEYEVIIRFAARISGTRNNHISNGITMLWNGAKILDTLVKENTIQEFRHMVKAEEGENTITIQGSGQQDTLGVTVSSVQLKGCSHYEEKHSLLSAPQIEQPVVAVQPAPEAEQLVLATLPASERVCTQHSDFIVNGDFTTYNLQGKAWTIVNKLDGWTLTEAEFGNGKLYNSNWGNHVVLELDGHKNNVMSQKIQLKAGEYEVIIRFAARISGTRNNHISNGITMLWNGAKILDTLVKENTIQEFRHMVKAEEGENTITIQGSGQKDTLGVTVSSVQLKGCSHYEEKHSLLSAPQIEQPVVAVQPAPEAEQLVLATLPASERVCTQHSDFIVNGDFTTYNLQGKAWTIVNKLDGWTLTEAEFGNGKLYNSNWGNHVVLELDGHKNNVMSQKIQLKAGEYEVIIRFAARISGTRNNHISNGITMLWNGAKILDTLVKENTIQEFRHMVKAEEGENTITIQGSGQQDTLGVTVSSVQLKGCSHYEEKHSLLSAPQIEQPVVAVQPAPEAEQLVLATLPASERVCTQHSDFIVNGDFTTYNLQGKAWTIVNKLDGWTLTEAEFGNGKLYNSNWGNHVVLELDGHKNNVMSQKIQLKAGEYEVIIRFAARISGTRNNHISNGITMLWNGAKILDTLVKENTIQEFRHMVKAEEGENTITIQGSGQQDTLGVTVSSVQLKGCSHYEEKHSLLSAPQIEQPVVAVQPAPEAEQLVESENILLPPSSLKDIDETHLTNLPQFEEIEEIKEVDQVEKLDDPIENNLDNHLAHEKNLIENIIQEENKAIDGSLLQGEETISVQSPADSLSTRPDITSEVEEKQTTTTGTIKAPQSEQYIEVSEEVEKNFLTNSDFRNVELYSSCCTEEDELEGWFVDHVTFGLGKSQNPNWGDHSVLKLEGLSTYSIEQEVELQEAEYELYIQYAARLNEQGDIFPASQGFKLYWNDEVIFNTLVKTKEIQEFRRKVIGLDGLNLLEIQGAGNNPRHGVSISKILLTGKYIQKRLVQVESLPQQRIEENSNNLQESRHFERLEKNSEEVYESNPLERVEPVTELSEGVEPVTELSEGVEPVTELSEGVEPVTELSEGVEPVTELSEGVEPVTELSEGVEPVTELSEGVKPVTELSEGVEPVTEPVHRVEPEYESSERVESETESSERVNHVIKPVQRVETKTESSERVNHINKNVHKVEPKTESSERVNHINKNVHKVEPKTKSSERVKPSTESSERVEPQTESSEKVKNVTKPVHRVETKTESSESVKPKTQSSERVKHENKPVHRDQPEDESTESVKPKTKSSERVKHENKPVHRDEPEDESTESVNDVPKPIHRVGREPQSSERVQLVTDPFDRVKPETKSSERVKPETEPVHKGELETELVHRVQLKPERDELVEHNFIKNGDFRNTNLNGKCCAFYTKMDGWILEDAEFGQGDLYNSHWGNHSVLELVGYKKNLIVQKLDLNAGEFDLFIQYAVNIMGDKKDIKPNGLKVYWNGKLELDTLVDQTTIQELRHKVRAVQGENFLGIEGDQDNDMFGISISQVKLLGLINKKEVSAQRANQLNISDLKIKFPK